MAHRWACLTGRCLCSRAVLTSPQFGPASQSCLCSRVLPPTSNPVTISRGGLVCVPSKSSQVVLRDRVGSPDTSELGNWSSARVGTCSFTALKPCVLSQRQAESQGPGRLVPPQVPLSSAGIQTQPSSSGSKCSFLKASRVRRKQKQHQGAPPAMPSLSQASSCAPVVWR